MLKRCMATAMKAAAAAAVVLVVVVVEGKEDNRTPRSRPRPAAAVA